MIIPNSVTSIGMGAFSSCSSLTSVIIPSSVTSIGDWAFSSCGSLTSVNIPNSVTSIGRQAFEDCWGLTSVTIGDNVTSIGWRAFENCINMTSVVLGNSVTSIDETFRGCSALSSIIIPNSVISISAGAFNGTVWYDNQPDGIIYLGKVLYEYKGNMPDNTNIVIDEGTMEIAGGAFFNCTGLSSVILPNSVTSIGPSAFSDCSSLSSVILPNSVTSIGPWAFAGCSSLTSVIIGNSVTYIGNECFLDCNSLTTLYVNNITPPGSSINTFDDYNYTQTTLYVPTGSKETYMEAYGWKNFISIKEFYPSTINSVRDEKVKEISRYSLDGKHISEPQKGINIIKMGDGSTKKVLVK